MYPLHERREQLRRHARLRSLLLQLARDEGRSFARALARLRCRLSGATAARQPPSTRWGSAFDILRQRLQHDLEDLQQWRHQRDGRDDGNAQDAGGAGPAEVQDT